MNKEIYGKYHVVLYNYQIENSSISAFAKTYCLKYIMAILAVFCGPSEQSLSYGRIVSKYST